MLPNLLAHTGVVKGGGLEEVRPIVALGVGVGGVGIR
jgi:hypothetical protein